MKRLLREPLLHFMLLGGAAFAVFALFGRTEEAPGPSDTRIVVTAGHLEPMITGFTRTWHRPPTPAELAGLVEDHVREEVLSREALAMGLDREDTIVRRRLRQKMEFLLEDASALATPTDADLEAYLRAHPAAFRPDDRLAFEHVYFSRERRGERSAAQATEALARLRAGAPSESAGDPFLLASEFGLTSRVEIARMFGEAFDRTLATAAKDIWTGPVESAYGLHLVRLRDRTQGRLPELDGIREAVAREWAVVKRKEITEGAYRKLRERYTIVVEPPRSTEAKP